MSSQEAGAAAAASTPGLVDPMRLAARWRSPAEWRKVEEELDAEPEPSHLNTMNSSGLFHIVSTDKMSVRYTGNQQHGHDVGVVQANCPAPTKRFAYYFEMTVKNAGLKGQIAIGFTMEQFKMRRQPGWEPNSYGYHGDDGCLYQGPVKGEGPAKGETFGPKFTTGDVVGAGIIYASQKFFFTKNGIVVGAVSKGKKDIAAPLYPTVAVHSQNEEVTVNFGKQPFQFELEDFINEEKKKQLAVVENQFLPPHISHWIVRSYLLHYGYEDTLASLDMATESNPSLTKKNSVDEQTNMYALNHRKVLRQLIRNGDIDTAFQKLREWYPKVVQDEMSVICFLLHSQRFIEYIRAGHLEDAVMYGRAELARYFAVKAFANLLEDTAALLAYNEPAESCVSYLLEPLQREFVADAVNASVLSMNPNLADSESCMYSTLEKLVRQLTVCTLDWQALNSNQGEAFYLHRELRRRGAVKQSSADSD